jgi:hypothetical protein
MTNLQCNKNASKYIQYFGKNKNIFTRNDIGNPNEIITILHEILNNIKGDVLTKKYTSFNDAKLNIPHDANQLINLVKMYNIYITECKNSIYTKFLTKHMCKKNQNIICKIYHLMQIWSLLLLQCLYFKNVTASNITNVNYSDLINYKIDTRQGITCIKNIKSNHNIQLAKQLLNCSIYLRKNVKKYCDIPLNLDHKNYIKTLLATQAELNKLQI